MKKVAIYGIGNFGYAILKHLDKYKSSSYNIFGYDRNEKVRNSLVKSGCHPIFHKGVKISKNIKIAKNESDLFKGADILILAITSTAIYSVINKNKELFKKDIIVVNTAKALDLNGDIFSKKIEKILTNKQSYAFLAGGTIAKDLFLHEPLGIDLASKKRKALNELKKVFLSPTLRVYLTTDLEGVELASSLKNVVSIFIGIIHGLGFSFGSETHFISRFSEEMKNFSLSLGAHKKTFSMGSQSWGNDLWMSCLGNTRNREFGVLIGKGNSVSESINIMKRKNKTIEGLNTIRFLGESKKINFKKYILFNSLFEIIYREKPAKRTIMNLLHNSYFFEI